MAQTQNNPEEGQQMTVIGGKKMCLPKYIIDLIDQAVEDSKATKGVEHYVKKGPGVGKLFASLMGEMQVQFTVQRDVPSAQPQTITVLIQGIKEHGSDSSWIINGRSDHAGEDGHFSFEAAYFTDRRDGPMWIDYE